MPAPIPTPDLLLARRAAAGQPAAWDEIISRYGQKLWNLAFHFAGTAAEAEDLTQEIFLRLHQSLGRYRGESPLAAWALKLSRNLCIDHYRRSRRERRSTVVSDEVLRQLPAADDPQAEAQARQQLRAVYGALEEMTEDMAEVVLLCDLQGFRLEEAAVYLEVPLGTVKSRLHRARLDLMERLAASTGARRTAEPALAVGSC
ncbi:MAG TPA: RNA polymerase sigma factor [Thermoanaerobaculia bacterium]|nr:RNA polymerase sigma factor [Thermoanaerobaculia bacterium]